MPESLADWVTLQAEQRPDAVAVVGGGRSLPYAELETRSNRLARILGEGGCVRGDRVCLLMPKSPEAIVALVGIYKAGGVYVPLDPSSPPARLAKILDSCDPRWILAAGSLTPTLDELLAGRPVRASVSIGWLEDDPPCADRALPRGTSIAFRAHRRRARAPATMRRTSSSPPDPRGRPRASSSPTPT